MSFLENKYSRTYFRIIDRARSRKLEGYSEGHHVIPKSIGGSNFKTNIVQLTPKEHFIAHHLLVHMTTGKERTKMLFAFWCMRRKNQHHDERVTAIFYNRIKLLHVEACKTRNTSRVYAKGYKRPQSELSKTNIGKANKGRKYYHDPITKEVVAVKNDQKIPAGYIPGNPNFTSGDKTRGTYWAHDPITKESKRIPKDQPLPTGLVKGDLKIWISNPSTGHRTFHNRYEPMPDGYVRGRIGGTR